MLIRTSDGSVLLAHLPCYVALPAASIAFSSRRTAAVGIAAHSAPTTARARATGRCSLRAVASKMSFIATYSGSTLARGETLCWTELTFVAGLGLWSSGAISTKMTFGYGETE